MAKPSLEIEHKFVVSDDFDEKAFVTSVRKLKPSQEFKTDVQDTYFFHPKNPTFVLRHRRDEKIQQLTIKSLRDSNNEVRTEVNLSLDKSVGDQIEDVDTFCATMGLTFKASLKKKVTVFEFGDAEIVYYVADNSKRSIRCVELEALERSDTKKGIATIAKYESALGFDASQREHKSLFEMLILPQMGS